MSFESNGDADGKIRSSAAEKPICFIIMPISDPEGYEQGHFQHVFQDLFVPACENAGYRPLRADQVRETNLIHLDVLQRIIDSPMVLCDLSSRNPNVLFELGLRQAFDKPVALVQEIGTPQIFDITPLRFVNYRRELIYHQVLEDQDGIAALLSATREAVGDPNSINSIVKLLGLTHPASIANITESDRDSAILSVIMTELANLRSEIRTISSGSPSDEKSVVAAIGRSLPSELAAVREELSKLEANIDHLRHDEIPPTDFSGDLSQLDTRLRVLLALLKEGRLRHERQTVHFLINRLMKVWGHHNEYLRLAKTEANA